MSIYLIDPERSKKDGIVVVSSSIGLVPKPSSRLLGPQLGVRSNPVIYGLNRQGLADGPERVRIFNGRARAKAWLLES